MKKPLIYLDNCCFNRPYDDQGQIRILLETQAKLFIQQQIKAQRYDLVWSFMLTAENDDNPYIERQQEILKWAGLAQKVVTPEDSILQSAQEIQKTFRISGKDAIHLACAIQAHCEYFLTTDDRLMKRANHLKKLVVLNPINFVAIMEGEHHDEN